MKSGVWNEEIEKKSEDIHLGISKTITILLLEIHLYLIW